MTNIYWDLFYQSGKIEQYLKYRGQLNMQPKGNENALTKSAKGSEGTSDSY